MQLSRTAWFGISIPVITAFIALLFAKMPIFQSLYLSPLTIAILLGVIIGNTIYHYIPQDALSGIRFIAQKTLRLGIIFYGLQITIQDIVEVGGGGFLIDLFIVGSVFLLGTWMGMRILKLDRDTAMLTAGGSAICGAAAVLALEGVLQAKSHKTTAAVVSVVLFGTLAMFLYPFLFHVLDLDTQKFGIYIGATVHEVAQVVAAGQAISSETAATAVIVKLTRVILLAPFLLFLSIYLARKTSTTSQKSVMIIPWFALGFVLMTIVNSTNIIPATLVKPLINIDIFLLSVAMAALGIETNIHKFKGMGWRVLALGGGLWIYLLLIGYCLVKWI